MSRPASPLVIGVSEPILRLRYEQARRKILALRDTIDTTSDKVSALRWVTEFGLLFVRPSSVSFRSDLVLILVFSTSLSSLAVRWTPNLPRTMRSWPFTAPRG